MDSQRLHNGCVSVVVCMYVWVRVGDILNILKNMSLERYLENGVNSYMGNSGREVQMTCHAFLTKGPTAV